MKKTWRRWIAGGILNCLILCQPIHKAFGQLPTDEEKISECGLKFKPSALENTGRNYLIRHLPDTDKWLTEEREKELVYLYQQAKDPSKKQQALTEIISGHINLIRKLAIKTARKWRQEDLAEDLIQDAILRLRRYLNIHDPERSQVVSYTLTYMPRIMNKRMVRYTSPVLVSDRYREEIEETEDLMIPIASELKTYKPDEGDNIDDNNVEDTQSKSVESWTEANESVKQIENFILQIGDTPRQRYILRHRIFSFEPEPSSLVAEKFDIHPSGVAIRDEEKKLMQKISGYLNNESSIKQDEIFTEIIKRIEEGNPFPLVNGGEINWQTENLARQIEHLIQEMDNSQEQNRTLKNQQAESLAKEAKLDEINLYILRHRLMEKPNDRQTLAAIAETFGLTQHTILSREQTILRRLEKTIFTSPELKQTAERIVWTAQQANSSTFPTEQKMSQQAKNLAEQMGLNEVEQHILRYRIMERPDKQQTLKAIGEMFNIKLQTIAGMQARILQKLQNTTFRSSKLKKTVGRILLEEKRRKGSALTSLDTNELDWETVNLAKQAEDFIMEIGQTPFQIYILRHRIFTLYPESSYSIADKFGYSNPYVTAEEQKLLKNISELLSGGPNMNKDQVFREVINRIRNGEFFFFVNNEINWQIEVLARQAGLNEIEAYTLRYRFLEEPNKRQTQSDIAKKFGKRTGTAITHWERSMLRKLNNTIFISPELKEIVERINKETQQKKRPVPIINTEQLAKERDNLPPEWKENDIYRYILENRLLKDPDNRQTQVEIANRLNVSRNIIVAREKAILRVLQERGLVSFQ